MQESLSPQPRPWSPSLCLNASRDGELTTPRRSPCHGSHYSYCRMASRLVSVSDPLSRTAEANQTGHSLIPGNLKINDNAHLLRVDKKEKIKMTSIVQAFLPPVVPGRRLLCRLLIFTPQWMNGCCDGMAFPLTWLCSLGSLSVWSQESQRSRLGA